VTKNKLVESKEIERVIKEEIYKLRNLGEHVRGGSDHLSYRSMRLYTEHYKDNFILNSDFRILEINDK